MLELRVLLLIALLGKSATGVSGHFRFLWLADYEGFSKIKPSGFEARNLKSGKAGVAKLSALTTRASTDCLGDICAVL